MRNESLKTVLSEEATGEIAPPVSGGAVTPPPAEPVAPAPEVSPSPEAQTGDSDVNWEEISAPTVDDDTLGGEVEDETIVDETVKVAEVAKPPAQPVQPAAAPVTPPVTPPTATQPQPQQPVEQPAQPQSVPAAPPVDLASLRAAEMTRLEQVYGMNDDEAMAMLVEPQKILPKVAANIHMTVMEQVIPAIMQRLPQVIGTLSRAEKVAMEAENEFFSTWPQLKDPKYQQTVMQSVAAYKQINPKAPRQEVIRAAGLQAMISLRLPLPRELLQMEPEQPPTVSPFNPAGPGGGYAPPAARRPQNAWSQLADEFVEDERAP